MARCSISVSFLRHNRLDMRKPKQSGAFSEWCHTAAFQTQTNWWKADAPQLSPKICSVMYLLWHDISYAKTLNKTPQNDLRIEHGAWNWAIIPVTLRKYGRPVHNPLCSLLAFWQVRTIVLPRILTLCLLQSTWKEASSGDDNDKSSREAMIEIMIICINRSTGGGANKPSF